MSLSWPGNALGSSWKSWRQYPGRGRSGCPCSGSCPRDLVPDKRKKMDGWMDGWIKIYNIKGVIAYICSNRGPANWC